MSVRPVRIYGDPVLRARAAEVTEFDDQLKKLVEDMRETMAVYRGVGLAANQVGELRRVLVVDAPLDDERRATFTLVNPVIESRSGSQVEEEGCLSMPGIYEDVGRSLEIKVRAQDESGRHLEIDAGGYVARVIQHEVDHLDGVLFVDRLSLLKRQFLKKSLDALARGEIPDQASAGGSG